MLESVDKKICDLEFTIDDWANKISTPYEEKDGVIYFPKGLLNDDSGEFEIDESELQGYRIRKLTPKECWRLMGFSDDDFNKAKSVGISDTQLYKQAGNSIVVDVLYYIYKELYEAMPYLFDNLKVGSFFSGIGAFEKGLDRLYADINANAV